VGDEGRGEIDVPAAVAQVWAVVCDVESYPSWMGDVRHAAVLERDELGRPSVAEFGVGGFGVTVGYALAYSYEEHRTVSWQLVRSRELRRMDGEYRFTATDTDDRPCTHVTYRLDVDLRIPVPGVVKRRAERLIIHHALTGLRDRVGAA
jgi:ribosome-associated toxin RatA of RatAB toxin-antitoxin module